MPTILKHISHDWCHICGKRSDETADVWYPANAEHATKKEHSAQIGGGTRYVRICAVCATSIAIAASGSNTELSGER